MKKNNLPYKFLIAGGGTGGHVFPAIAIANALKEFHADSHFLFMGALGKIEMIKVPEAGYKIIGLPISGWQRKKLFSNILLPFKVGYSFLLSLFWIIKFKPNIAIGVGGYASLPALLAANFMKIPVVVQEQNAFAGLANKMLRNKAKAFFVAYENMEQFFPKSKIRIIGNPIRQNLTQTLPDASASKIQFGLNLTDKVLLVVGGSLGATSINNAIAVHVEYFFQNKIQVIWQTGTAFFESQAQNFSSYSNLKIFPFIKNIEAAYAAADIIISRAGAGAIAELCVIAKPTIFIPSPNVTDDHQTKNALSLKEADAAQMIADDEVKEKIILAIENILQNENLKTYQSLQLKKRALPHAAQNIALEILKIINPNHE